MSVYTLHGFVLMHTCNKLIYLKDWKSLNSHGGYTYLNTLLSFLYSTNLHWNMLLLWCNSNFLVTAPEFIKITMKIILQISFIIVVMTCLIQIKSNIFTFFTP